jgi:hypothetical protein
MAWLIAAIGVVVLLVFFMGFRKSALGVLVTTVIGGFLLYQYNQQRERQSTTRIPQSEIVLENVAVRPTFGSSYDLTGRVKNNSKAYRLDGIEFKVTMRDCEDREKSSCVIIGEAPAYVSLTVPPQEARDFNASLYFGSNQKKAKGLLAWDHEITAIVAKRQ